MKFKVGDRVSCKFGSGEVIRAKEPKDTSLAFTVYFIKMASPEKYKGLEMLFAEQELELEPKVKCECEKEWRTRETLGRITAKFEQEKAKGKVNPKTLAGLMTEMERAFDIPLINNKDFNEKNKEVIELCRAISDSRDLLRENTKIKKRRKEIGRESR